MTDDTADLIDVPARAIAAAAQALWGPLWQSEMARELKTSLRRVQRIAAAARDDQTYLLPRTLLAALLGRLEHKHFPLQRAYEDLRLIHDQAAAVTSGAKSTWSRERGEP